MRYVKEELVLKPKSESTTDASWPCYVLTEATVYRSDGRTIANPLHVHLEGPMVIRGKLVIDDEDDDAVSNRMACLICVRLCLLANGFAVINPATRTAYIEIRDSDRYSIGYKPTVFWLSGSAGWFEIEPSPEYEAMYKEVQEAITLYYSVIMVYENHKELCDERRKKKKGPPQPPTLDHILFQVCPFHLASMSY